jgi:hypothetical protein
MLALAFCATAIVYLYVEPLARHCCRRNRKPVPAELVNEYKDL